MSFQEIFNQAEHNIRCEWGRHGVPLLAHISDVVIIVDILSFTKGGVKPPNLFVGI